MAESKPSELTHTEELHDVESKVGNDTLALYHSYSPEDAATIEKRVVRKLDMVRTIIRTKLLKPC